jgi:hypothetical protein
MDKLFYALAFTASIFTACSTAGKPVDKSRAIPFVYVEKTFIVVPVTVNGSITANFVLDTGIGINLISKSLCEKLGCKIKGSHSGKRMSGQDVAIPMSSVNSLALGGLLANNPATGVFDLEPLMPGMGIQGFLSLGFFKDQAFSIDYKNQVIILEDKESLKKAKADGVRTPVRTDIQGESLVIFMPMTVSKIGNVSVEVDTGSQALILDERFMHPLGIAKNDPSVRRRDGKDETGHSYSRYFTTIPELVHLPNTFTIGTNPTDVMFQKIIYDGLVGHNFLSQFLVTYNLPEFEMIFRKFAP